MIVLDTHTLLWMDRDDPALGLAARKIIKEAWRKGETTVSAISFWEAAMLAGRRTCCSARFPLRVAVRPTAGWTTGNSAGRPHRPALHPARKASSRSR